MVFLVSAGCAKKSTCLHSEPGISSFCQRRTHLPVEMSEIWISPIMRLAEP